MERRRQILRGDVNDLSDDIIWIFENLIKSKDTEFIFIGGKKRMKFFQKFIKFDETTHDVEINLTDKFDYEIFALMICDMLRINLFGICLVGENPDVELTSYLIKSLISLRVYFEKNKINSDHIKFFDYVINIFTKLSDPPKCMELIIKSLSVENLKQMTNKREKKLLKMLN